MDEARARALLAERRARRLRDEQRQRVIGLTAIIRAFYYPEQREFLTSKAKKKATRKTRRAGATTGGCREIFCRALELDGYRATYINATRIEARQLAWESDTQGGLIDLLREYGKDVSRGGTTVYDVCGVEVLVREAELALVFSNGSRLDLFGADDERSLNKLRGRAKHLFWIDEAQKFRFLDKFYKAVISPALADFDHMPGGGECWMTGTPDRDCSGFFFDVTRDDAPGLDGWEVHTLNVTMNPCFGATPEERWERTAGAAMRENGWKDDDPDLLREWFARWVRTDARFVYAANSVPIHELLYAPERFMPDGFPDVLAAMRDLPGFLEGREYFLAMGNDLGTYAFSLRAWSLHDPNLYEVASYKRRGLDYDDMIACIISVRDLVNISVLVADAGGGGKQAVMGWSKKIVDRYGLPIIEATKTNKHTAIDVYNNDLRKGRLKYRGTPDAPSPLLHELLTHRWLPTRSATGKMVEDPSTDNHCCDADLYAHRESYHHRFREQPLQPEPGSAESLAREERELEEAAIAPDEDLVLGW